LSKISMFDSLKNTVNNITRDVYTSIVSAPTESKFLEKGVLTPKEFVLAGDQLVTTCPSWEWKPASSDKLAKPELPKEKQYLYSKVPCQKRVKDLIRGETKERDAGDGWFMSEGTEEKEAEKEHKMVKVDVDDIEGVGKGTGEEDGYYEEEEIDGIKVKVFKKKEQKKVEEESKDDFETITAPETQRRYYELGITYDFYYNTPRLWLSGYSEDNIPLTEAEMFEDIMDEYAKKTVTYETHPHLGIKQLSIHPCKHADVMKHLLDVAIENGSKIEVHHALFVFLKFISSVVPTMEYDFTVDIELGA